MPFGGFNQTIRDKTFVTRISVVDDVEFMNEFGNAIGLLESGKVDALLIPPWRVRYGYDLLDRTAEAGSYLSDWFDGNS